MPDIFDNIENPLLEALRVELAGARRADFCVGYFNLRGWRELAPAIEGWDGSPENRCRLLVGMTAAPEAELRRSLRRDDEGGIDAPAAKRALGELAKSFRRQLTWGVPTAADEAGLRQLAAQLRAGRLVVKVHLRHPLHAKLYLLHREANPRYPWVGFLGSSNLTLAGLRGQGELNIDVPDNDAAEKLVAWFEARWNDKFCLDLTADLIEVLEESWAREDLLPPYWIYLKMAYHLSEDARAGLAEFRVPAELAQRLLPFQVAAVQIAARHLNRRGGVLLGDVVGLGKTLMATAIAKIFELDHGLETLILCPKGLVPMWKDYCDRYGLRARVLSLSRVQVELPELARFRVVLIDESHNLRNREGKRYQAIQDYVHHNQARVILLSATPYNKSYRDLSAQLRLFLAPDQPLPVRPERLLRELGETEFVRRHQCEPNTLDAFDLSEHAEDWRELMRFYLVRRTRSFIEEVYAEVDAASGRKFLRFENGERRSFPVRRPRTVTFAVNPEDPADPYARLFAAPVADAIGSLRLPRYGLANYLVARPTIQPVGDEVGVLRDLSRAGRRLMGFCRTNLFKRLESSGASFLRSLERHLLRNHVFLHALEQGLPVPIGPQDSAALDTRLFDEDTDSAQGDLFAAEGDPDDAAQDEAASEAPAGPGGARLSLASLRARAARLYEDYRTREAGRYRWVRPQLFRPVLRGDLEQDNAALTTILERAGAWDPATDRKLGALVDLLLVGHPREKVLVFSQFADTVRYLEAELRRRGVAAVAAVTGATADATALAWRFSPDSNGHRHRLKPGEELRVLLATDVLSEGQNLQDAPVVLNYDLPWAIIRLIQRVGRVDRIGQEAAEIQCYSFLPPDGVERVLGLRARVRARLRENAEVVGTDEAFFEDETDERVLHDLYHERAGVLDEEPDAEVDLSSQALAIWKRAVEREPSLEERIPKLPDVVFSTKAHAVVPGKPAGALVYLRTGDGLDALTWLDAEGRAVSHSHLAVLEAAACPPQEPALPRRANHHELVASGVDQLLGAERARASLGGQLGGVRSPRYRTWERLKKFVDDPQGRIFPLAELASALTALYQRPLRNVARETLDRQLRTGISDADLAAQVLRLWGRDELVQPPDERTASEPRIVCSLGLVE